MKLVLSGSFHTMNFGLISRPLHCITQCFILHGILPSNWQYYISLGDYPQEIGSFRTILHSEFQTHFKTPVNHMSHSVNGLFSRPFRRRKEHRVHCSTVLVTFWTPFKTLHRKSRRHRTQDNWKYHSLSSSHHRLNMIVPNNHFSDF